MENKEPLLSEVLEAYERGEIEKNFKGVIYCRPNEDSKEKSFWIGSQLLENLDKLKELRKQEEKDLMWGNYKTPQ
jgi:hypothetical protein